MPKAPIPPSTASHWQSSGLSVNALPRFGEGGRIDPVGLSTSTLSASGPLALYIHIPFCLTICRFCMLRRGATSSQAVPEEYLDAVLQEIGLHSSLRPSTGIAAAYVGGGTPSLLSPFQIQRLVRALRALPNASNIEITFEGEAQSLLRPGVLSALHDTGIGRLSFGIQSFDPSARELLGRTDTVHDLWALRSQLDKFTFRDTNVDLLYNLPGQTPETLAEELRQLRHYNPTSIDCHPLKYASCAPSMLTRILARKLPVPQSVARAEAFSHIRSWMLVQGYVEQFTDQYCTPSLVGQSQYMHRLYGNLGGEYIGCGTAARSHIADLGYTNHQSLRSYYEDIAKGALPIARGVYAPHGDNYVTCFPKRNDELSASDVGATSDPPYFIAALRELAASGLVAHAHGSWHMTTPGLPYYQLAQERLLSPTQSANHRATAAARLTKLTQFGKDFGDLSPK